MNVHRFAMMLAAASAAVALNAGAAEPATTISKDEAKSLKAQSEGQYKARKNVAEANEDMNRADCKSALEGSAKRACEKSAKHAAKSDKAAAKALHEMEEKKIDDAKK